MVLSAVSEPILTRPGMVTVGEHLSKYWLFSETMRYMSSTLRLRVEPRDWTVTVRVSVPRSEKLSVT